MGFEIHEGQESAARLDRFQRRAVLLGSLAAGLALLGIWRILDRFFEAYAIREAPPPAPDERGEDTTDAMTLEEMLLNGCPTCGMGYVALPSKTFLRHYTEPDPTRGSR